MFIWSMAIKDFLIRIIKANIVAGTGKKENKTEIWKTVKPRVISAAVKATTVTLATLQMNRLWLINLKCNHVPCKKIVCSNALYSN